MNINITMQELVDNFSLFDDWEDRYRYLIDLGDTLPPMQESLKTEATKVRGCMSQVWMVLSWDQEGRMDMLADSDAQIVRGLIGVLRILFQGKSRDEIAAVDMEGVFRKIGLDTHLSPNRRNGFFSMVERIRLFSGQCT